MTGKDMTYKVLCFCNEICGFRQTEERAQRSETKVMDVENDLKDAHEKIRELEKQITQLENETKAKGMTTESTRTTLQVSH